MTVDGMVSRFDFARFDRVERTPQGGMRIPATVTRAGVLAYQRADGSTVRELRPPDEVFHADSLKTLSGAPVTDLHPPSLVSPDNWQSLSVGHVGESVKRDGELVAADLLIQDAGAIAAVENKTRRELSCGYTCRIDETPGNFNGQPYDVVQREIRYNHVAIGPVGWGRAGRDVALRLDSGGAIHDLEETQGKKMSVKYRVDGIDYDTSTPEFVQALSQRDARNDADNKAVAAERDSLKGERDGLAAKLAEANDPKRLTDAISARVSLERDAGLVCGTAVKFDGKTDRELMIEVVKHDDASFVADGKTDDYLRGRFEAVAKAGRSAGDGGNGINAAAGAALHPHRTGPADRQDANDSNSARERMIATNREASSQPLRFSRQS